MDDTQRPAPDGKTAIDEDRPAFLVIAAGGAGKAAAMRVQKQHRAAGAPFPIYRLALDTDPSDFEAFDSAINIAPTREAVSAMAVNPQRYGPACQAIVKDHPHLLENDTLGKGARTNRIITQAAFELFDQRITKGLRAAIQALLRQGHFDRILPVLLLSFGGGTGSATAVLMPDYLTDPDKKGQIMLGLPPDLVAKPVAFVIDAYAHALQQHNDVAPDWILSNIYASRVELAERERQGKGYQYVFHLGLGNDAGAVFSTIDQVCEANGLLAWEWMLNYPQFKSRAVDGLDFYMTRCRYTGDDVPELFFPREELPPYADLETAGHRNGSPTSA